MKKVKGLAAILTASVVCLLLAGCTGNGKKMTFSEFCDYEFKDTLAQDSFLTHFTVKDPSVYDISFEDYNLGDASLDEMKNGEKEIKGELKKLYAYDRSKLSEEEQITYDCLEFYLLTQQELQKGYMMQNAFALHSGIAANLSTNFIEFSFYNKDDVDHYLLYIKDVPRYIGQVCDFTREQSEKGYFMPDKIADLVIEQCQKYLDADVDPLIESFNNKINELDFSDSEKQQYIEQDEEYVKEYFQPAYQTMIDLMNELKGSGKNEGGLAGFGDEGKEYYEAIIRNKTSSDYSIEEIKDTLDQKASDILKEMSAIVMTDFDAYNESLTYGPSMDDPEVDLQYIIEKMKNDFPDPLTTNFNIEYQSKACEVDGTIAYYMPCPLDDLSINNIKVNGSAVENNTMELYTTLAHEGYPGHLYEFTSFYGDDDVPNVRKILDFIGATEGWAEYASDCVIGYLDIDDNVEKLYKMNSFLTYIVISRLDIGVNYEGWDIDDAYDYLSTYFQTDKNYDDEDNVVSYFYYEVVGDPGAFVPYTLGHMFMNDMREKAEEELGDDFDAKEYHQWLLDVGVAPFPVYNSELDEWLAAKKEG